MEKMIKEMETKLSDLVMIQDMLNVKDERIKHIGDFKIATLSGSLGVEIDMATKSLQGYKVVEASGKTSGLVYKNAVSQIKNNYKTIVKRWDKVSAMVNFEELRGTEIEATISIPEPVDVNVLKCPKCGSTNIHTDKKGFGIGKAVVGTAVTGLVGGVLLGGMGRKKLEHTCINCNNRFKNK